jgi:hypothetical protein
VSMFVLYTLAIFLYKNDQWVMGYTWNARYKYANNVTGSIKSRYQYWPVGPISWPFRRDRGDVGSTAHVSFSRDRGDTHC